MPNTHLVDPHEADSVSDNPFRTPSTLEIFQRRQKEKRERLEKRKQNLSRPVSEKTTFASCIATSTIKVRDEKLPHETPEPSPRLIGPSEFQDKVQKENMSDFLQHKREMFLLQMSLDSTRREIRKLDEKIDSREEKLKQDEKLLEQDIRKFDEFLKANDVSAVEAMKIAEKETKARQVADQENKRLSQQINSLNNESAKYRESLSECVEYKKFLDSLTPEEWKENRRKERIQEKKKREEQGLPVHSQDVLDENFEMYFTDPQMLLDVFRELETRNLTLIQRCQESEEKLELLEQQFASEQANLETQGQLLQEQINFLEESIQQEKTLQMSLKEKKTSSFSSDGFTRPEVKERIHNKIESIFKEAGLGSDSNIDTLSMLRVIETKLTQVISDTMELPPAFRAQKEKERERFRRKVARDKKMKEQSQMQRQRVQRVLLRSQEPVRKAIGKPLMYRSVPPADPVKHRMQDANHVKNQNSEDNRSNDEYFDFLK